MQLKSAGNTGLGECPPPLREREAERTFREEGIVTWPQRIRFALFEIPCEHREPSDQVQWTWNAANWHKCPNDDPIPRSHSREAITPHC